MNNHLLYFYGEECPDCIRMQARISRLEKEEGISLVPYEVWHNADNDELCMKYDDGRCGGIPFFYNTQTKESLCGEVTYKELKDWAMD
jgi:thiol-disulfide isomerase/thioredoxin